MKKDFFKYLKSYSYDPHKIDRIIVSSFLYSNNIQYCENQLVEQLRINEDNPDYPQLKKILMTYSIVSIEDLIEVFEFVVSPEEKIVTGAVYTPFYVREFIVNQVIKDECVFDQNFRICDPACGCSGFLYTAAKKIKEISGKSYSTIYSENLFGLDIQVFSIKRSKLLLTLAAILEGEDATFFEFNLFIGNALSFDWSKNIANFTGFNGIIGNPPYVCSRNLDDVSKSLVNNLSVSKSGHPDLYIAFFELGITLLKHKAFLGFISMNTFFKSVNGRALREYFQEKKLCFDILDFGTHQVFESKSTYTCICIIQNLSSAHLNYTKITSTNLSITKEKSFQAIRYDDLDSERGWNLQEREILNRIEEIGTPFGEIFTSRNGIATLKNDVYIFDPIRENDHFYYLQNGKQYPIERDSCVDVINPNKLTKTSSIDSLRKKIIFPYNIEKGQPKIISEDEFKTRFPYAYNYLLTKRDILSRRDKGKGKDYDIWYSYGRNQSLERYKFKLFFPHISQSTPNFVINNEPSLLFVNGLAVVGEDERKLQILSRIMSSRLFWFYITNSSKPYGSDYFSLSRNYIKNFGIFNFTDDQIDSLLNIKSQVDVDEYLENLYGINLEDANNSLISFSSEFSKPVKEYV